jgi:hypothetical protein
MGSGLPPLLEPAQSVNHGLFYILFRFFCCQSAKNESRGERALSGAGPVKGGLIGAAPPPNEPTHFTSPPNFFFIVSGARSMSKEDGNSLQRGVVVGNLLDDFTMRLMFWAFKSSPTKMNSALLDLLFIVNF